MGRAPAASGAARANIEGPRIDALPFLSRHGLVCPGQPFHRCRARWPGRTLRHARNASQRREDDSEDRDRREQRLEQGAPPKLRPARTAPAPNCTNTVLPSPNCVTAMRMAKARPARPAKGPRQRSPSIRPNTAMRGTAARTVAMGANQSRLCAKVSTETSWTARPLCSKAVMLAIVVLAMLLSASSVKKAW